MSALHTLSVIIVTYNTADLIEACLSSVLASRRVKYEVFVVDNASKDAGVELVRSKFPSVRLIANPDNRGFGKANNQALRESSGEYVVFLNPDTTIEPDALASMAAYMQAQPKVGLAGPCVLNPDGSHQESVSYRYPGHRIGSADLGPLPGEVACVLGACQIASGDLLRELGGFDEDFFLYGEDQDLCLRVRKLGREIGVIKDVTIMHHGGKSERTTLPAEVVRKKVRAELLFYRKHYRPHTVRRLATVLARRAQWRILSLRAALALGFEKERSQAKLARYQVIREESLASLNRA